MEWNLFVETETALKKEDNIFMAIAFLIIGIPVLMMKRNTSFFTACLYVIPFAIFIPWLRFKIVMSHIKSNQKNVLVHFHPNYIIINDKKIELFSENRWIKNMEIVDCKNVVKLLEIDIAWSTRKGNIFDELRIPIPLDKLAKAEMLIEFYRNHKGH